MDKIEIDKCTVLEVYDGLSLLTLFTDKNDNKYVSVLVDVDEEFDFYLVSLVDENDLDSYLNKNIDLLSLIKISKRWYLCKFMNEIIKEYSRFSEIPDDYLPS